MNAALPPSWAKAIVLLPTEPPDTIRGSDFQARGLRLALAAGETRRVVRGIALDAGILASGNSRREHVNLGAHIW